MSIFTEEQGDLFDPTHKVIAHGCNCVGLMGAGVAKLVRQESEYCYKRYKTAIAAGVFVPGYAQFVMDESVDRCYYNLATQAQPGADATYFNVYLAACNMYSHAKANGISLIHIPRIGAGIGGLEWLLVRNQFQQADSDVGYGGTTIVIYQ